MLKCSVLFMTLVTHTKTRLYVSRLACSAPMWLCWLLDWFVWFQF